MRRARNILNLSEGEVHLWITNPGDIDDPHLLDRYRALMTEEESVKQQRFIFAKDRHQSLVTRAMVRTVLSHYAGVAPRDWRFSLGAHGKPEIIDPPFPLRFNLSHTQDFVLCAVTLEQDLGADVEYVLRDRLGEGIAERYFSSREVEDLHALATDRQRDRFFDYWTLKESYIKARGLGLSMPLDSFSFSIDDDGIGIRFENRDDDPDNWKFWLLRPNRTHRIAVAAGGGHPHADLKIFSTVPLGGYSNTTFPL